MKASAQCGIAASKCNTVFGLIRRNITYKENTIQSLSETGIIKATVRPHLEYFIQQLAMLIPTHRSQTYIYI